MHALGILGLNGIVRKRIDPKLRPNISLLALQFGSLIKAISNFSFMNVSFKFLVAKGDLFKLI